MVTEQHNPGSGVQFFERMQTDRELQRPDTAGLQDAVVDGKLLVDCGGLVIIERWTDIFNRPGKLAWLDTAVYRIDRVDHESGDIVLWDTEYEQCAWMNFKKGVSSGYVFKLVTPGLRVDELSTFASRGIKKVKAKRSKKISYPPVESGQRPYVTVSGVKFYPPRASLIADVRPHSVLMVAVMGDAIEVLDGREGYGYKEVWTVG